MDQNNEYVTPHTEDTPDPLAQELQSEEQSLTSDPNKIQDIKERQAFETYVQSSGDSIPENFRDAGAWFDSLKEAQKQYTQSRQEVADLKAKYMENGVENPDYQESPAPTPEHTPEPMLTDELRIPNTPETTLEKEAEASVKGVPEEEYLKWGTELATHGKLSAETRETIKSMTGFTEGMINDYEMAQHARLKNRFDDASKVVGGREQLDKMFKWATASLDEAERNSINAGLSSAQYDITLRGLAAKYNDAVTAPKAKEPNTTPQNLASVPDSQAGYIGYKTHREFKADRNNPKYKLEQKFRNAVEERMSRTNWNTLPA